MDDDFADIRARLTAIGEELDDRAMAILRDAVEAGATTRPAAEKQLVKARRAIEKAVHLLGG